MTETPTTKNGDPSPAEKLAAFMECVKQDVAVHRGGGQRGHRGDLVLFAVPGVHQLMDPARLEELLVEHSRPAREMMATLIEPDTPFSGRRPAVVGTIYEALFDSWLSKCEFIGRWSRWSHYVLVEAAKGATAVAPMGAVEDRMFEWGVKLELEQITVLKRGLDPKLSLEWQLVGLPSIGETSLWRRFWKADGGRTQVSAHDAREPTSGSTYQLRVGVASTPEEVCMPMDNMKKFSSYIIAIDPEFASAMQVGPVILIGDGGAFVLPGPATIAPPRVAVRNADKIKSIAASRAIASVEMPAAWVSVSKAAAALGFGAVSFRRVIERNARRAKDGTTEAVVDGVRARKIGRTWRVLLSAAWMSATPEVRRVVHELGGSTRLGGVKTP